MNNFKNIWNELTSEPGRLFGLVYPYVLVIIIIIGVYYVSNLGYVTKQNISTVLPDTTMQTDLPVVEPKTIPPINIMEVSKPSTELLTLGTESYMTICASCHGENGMGDGPASTGLNPSPRNYTSKEGWKNGPALSQIYQTLEEGIPGSSMISYNYLPPKERIALAHYIRETFVPDPPKDSESELQALDQVYSLSLGKEIPAQIPVKSAINIISEENDSIIQNIAGKVKQADFGSGEGAKIFKQVTSNEIKALTMLNADKGWKQDYQKFVRSLVYNVERNGFNHNVFNLSSNDWDALYNYMNSLF